MTHDLPGTDPRFHESRNYLSPANVDGMMILAAHGSCKEDGCGYRGAWRSTNSRDRAMQLHRALRVREARMNYFIKLFGTDNQAKLGQLFLETTDNNSHFYQPWLDTVKHLYVALVADPEVIDLPEYDYYKDYKDGQSAKSMVDFIFEAGLR